MGYYNEQPTMVGDRFVKVDFSDCGPYQRAQKQSHKLTNNF